MDADVIIIGAGPAGSTAALLLARAGRNVLVLEKTRFPRPKICGGCLSGAAVTFLERQFGAKSIWPGTPVEQIQFIFGSYQLNTRVHGRTRIVERSEFDQFLADEAQGAGGRFIFGSSARVLRASDGFEIEHDGMRLKARYILVATGVGGLSVDFSDAQRAPSHRMLAQQWVEPRRSGLPDVGMVEMHWLRGGYVGLATPRESCTIVAYAAEATSADSRPPWVRLRELNPKSRLWEVLDRDAPQRNEARGTAGFPWRPKCLGQENVLLIGDAAGYREPFSGEGMGQAMLSAEHAVRAVLSGTDVQARYAASMRRDHAPGLRRLQWLGDVLRFNLIHRLANVPAVLPQGLVGRAVEWIHVRNKT